MSLQSDCPFSMSPMHKALQHLCFSKGISACIAPPGFSPLTSYLVTYTRLHKLFMKMTGSKGVVISKQDREEVLMTVSLLTSDSNYFMAVIRNQYGSRRVQTLLRVESSYARFRPGEETWIARARSPLCE